MKRISTLFLRVAIIVLGFVGLLLTTLLSRGVFAEWPLEFPDVANLRYVAVAVLATTGVCFIAALYQGMKLLNYIDSNTAFSKLSVLAFRKVKLAATVMGVVLIAGMPFVYMIANKDDAPGLVLIGMAIAGAPFVVAVASAVAERLLENVINIKSENDLTV